MGLHYNVTLVRPSDGQRFTVAAKRCPGEAFMTADYGVRALSYCEMVWDRVVGEPEAWELPLYEEGCRPNLDEGFFVDVERVAGAIHEHFGVPGPSAIFE